MYCVVQELRLKRPNIYGAYKNLEVYTVNIEDKIRYGYEYTGEQFERPIKTTYKISIHKSKRVNGVVAKQQYAVTTMDYYSFAESSLEDCILPMKLDNIAENLNTDANSLLKLIYSKIDILQERINEEFEQTEEFKIHAEHEQIIKTYKYKKAEFAAQYQCHESEYDFCFNVFGELMNKEYHDKIINDAEIKRSYREQSNDSHSNFKWESFNGKNNSDNHNFFALKAENYTDDEKIMLKKFYKTLSKVFHPDVNKNDGREMQLINRLKESWGV